MWDIASSFYRKFQLISRKKRPRHLYALHIAAVRGIGCTKTDTEVCPVVRFDLILRRHRRLFGGAALALAAAAILWAVTSPAIVGVAAATRELPIYSVSRDNKAVALSFDAAWGNEDTELLINTLDRYGVKATFFLVGMWADKYPESVQQLYDAGMELGNHSDDHPHMAKLSDADIADQITRCNAKIEAITGEAPTLFRCPYGEYDDDVIATVNSLGMHAIQWNVDSLDWKDLSADEIYNRVTQKVVPGSIILFHNAAKHTPEALPGIIEYLLSEGYTIVPVSKLLLKGEYSIDNTGMMCPAGKA